MVLEERCLRSSKIAEMGQVVKMRLIRIISASQYCYLLKQLMKLILEAVYPDWPKSPIIPAAREWVLSCMLE